MCGRGDADGSVQEDPGRRRRRILGGLFAPWYEAEYASLVAVLERLGVEHHTARDIAAEAFSRALERWERVGRMQSPTGWTYQVAFNLLHRHARRTHLERQVLSRAHPESPAAPAEVWDAVRALPPRQRTAVVLHYLLDLPYAEVARHMGIAEGTVAATLSGARSTLRKSLGDGFFGDDTRG